jgi:hypothetical protein
MRVFILLFVGYVAIYLTFRDAGLAGTPSTGLFAVFKYGANNTTFVPVSIRGVGSYFDQSNKNENQLIGKNKKRIFLRNSFAAVNGSHWHLVFIPLESLEAIVRFIFLRNLKRLL